MEISSRNMTNGQAWQKMGGQSSSIAESNDASSLLPVQACETAVPRYR